MRTWLSSHAPCVMRPHTPALQRGRLDPKPTPRRCRPNSSAKQRLCLAVVGTRGGALEFTGAVKGMECHDGSETSKLGHGEGRLYRSVPRRSGLGDHGSRFGHRCRSDCRLVAVVHSRGRGAQDYRGKCAERRQPGVSRACGAAGQSRTTEVVPRQPPWALHCSNRQTPLRRGFAFAQSMLSA